MVLYDSYVSLLCICVSYIFNADKFAALLVACDTIKGYSTGLPNETLYIMYIYIYVLVCMKYTLCI